MSALGFASYFTLALLAVGYFYLYSLHRAKYFAWVSLAWAITTIQVMAELSVARLSPPTIASITLNGVSAACFGVAIIYLHAQLGFSRATAVAQFLTSISVPVVIVSVRFFLWQLTARDIVLAASAVPQFLLACTFARLEPQAMLPVLRHRASTRRDTVTSPTSVTITTSTIIDSDPQISSEVIHLLSGARNLLLASFVTYGFLQILYVLRTDYRFPEWYAIVFAAALLIRGLHLAALIQWLLADARGATAALRLRSVAEELGVLTASMEHDIRNPLNNLSYEIDTAKRQYQNNTRIVALLNRLLLQVSRISAAVSIIPTTRSAIDDVNKFANAVNIVSLVRAAVAAVKKVDRTGTISITLSSARSEILVYGHGERLIQAFVAIINNGIEACRARAPHSPPHVSIWCSLDAPGNMAEIAIRDKGVGLTPETMEMLGRPFFTTKADIGQNRGVGLFLVCRIINIHRGVIRFESDGETFTKVTIQLPVAITQRRESG